MMRYENLHLTMPSEHLYVVIMYSRATFVKSRGGYYLQDPKADEVACVAGGFVRAGSKRLVAKPPQRAAKLPPHSSRGFAAKTFDPTRTKPPATQATDEGGKHLSK